MAKAWLIGNTTVRNPYRLADGLRILVGSEFHGALKGKDTEDAFARLLAERGLVTLRREKGDASDLGRKWRAAYTQLGLISPDTREIDGVNSEDLTGPPFLISKSGKQLIGAASGPAIQEQFLRILAAYYIPSPWENSYKFSVFSPLRHVLKIILKLSEVGEEPKISFQEMAVIVQFSNSDSDMVATIEKISELRRNRQKAQNKRRFDADLYREAASAVGYAESTFTDYADANLRYLKATGLFVAKGRGIAISSEKNTLVQLLLRDELLPQSSAAQIRQLLQGAVLPTDNASEGIAYLRSLADVAVGLGVNYKLEINSGWKAAEISGEIHKLEAIILFRREEVFAANQAADWKNIVAFTDAILTKRPVQIGADEDGIPITVSVPVQERPAYLEWVLWRMFLAIDSLKSPPYASRRFSVDNEFWPIGPAPGKGADTLFEFEDFIVVGEATLTESSRQEAAEGESVRRHVADVVRESDKRVFGLFLAAKIDSNTAETFRVGSWYFPSDERIILDIVPISLLDFRNFFEALFIGNAVDASEVRQLLLEISRIRWECDGAPRWKAETSIAVSRQIQKILMTKSES